jgi:hypothetical protein
VSILKEVGWFIPPQPTKRIGVMPKTKLVQQTEDVLVDTRGNIYNTDKQWGLFVLRYTAKASPRRRPSSERPPFQSRYAAFPGAGSEEAWKYFDGGNTPAWASSCPTRVRISSAQSAQVSSLIPRCRRATWYSAPPK